MHKEVPYDYGNKAISTLHFNIINVENDEKVFSQIANNAADILKHKNAKIIGLKDMYSEKYRKMSSAKINPEITKKFIQTNKNSISKIPHSDRISFHFSIMEVEAWWLSMFTIFEKIDPSLSIDRITEITKIDLSKINVENEIFHPSMILKKILKSVNKKYDKKATEVESITRQMTIEDIKTGISNNRCISLKNFYMELLDLAFNSESKK